MESMYDKNSQKYSLGYAEPENSEYSKNYNGNVGFADSLESQYYYDCPAASVTRDRGDYAVSGGKREKPARTNRETRTENRYYGNTSARASERANNLHTRYAERKVEEEYDNGESHMPYTVDETAPTMTTLQYKTNEQHTELLENYRADDETAETKQYTINTKGKILIAVYALVVITVFALIILNTRLLKTMNATSHAKEMQITKLTEEVNQLHAELEYVSSDEVISEKAVENGMVKE